MCIAVPCLPGCDVMSFDQAVFLHGQNVTTKI